MTMKYDKEKTKVHILIWPDFPLKINLHKVKKWKSKLMDISFENAPICNDHKRFFLTQKNNKAIKKENKQSQTYISAEFMMEDFIKKHYELYKEKYNEKDLYVFVTNFKLKNNFFCKAHVINNLNIVYFSYANIYDLLIQNEIPIGNALLTNIYAYVLYYRTYGKLPKPKQEKSTFHSDACGCLFDYMEENKDVALSSKKTIICSHCKEKFKENNKDMQIAEKEIKHIKQSLFVRIKNTIKESPIISILITLLTPLFLSQVIMLFTDPNKSCNNYIVVATIGILLIFLPFFAWIKFQYKNKKGSK